MQIPLHHIAGREGVLREVREEQFVDDPCACHPNRALFLSCRMRGDDQAAGRTIGSHRNLRAIIKAALHLTFGALLYLIRWEMQPGRDARMIEQVIVFAARL